MTVSGTDAAKFGSSAVWTQGSGTLVLTVATVLDSTGQTVLDSTGQ
eukprot:CAMPEP_0114551786 /NCGR_PEP_ID=MMETSP0114-20121206/6785_1 /TAXON_ID=31324 /ORGANISM="Goniomonas sp, Strain m" /LENGTH=45 /DNA_ID= /DNA_START= /DNA_END= /DNA_ORIENTATION=